MKVYPDPVGVLTNNPPFPFHQANLSQYLGMSAAQPECRLDPDLGLEPFGQGMGAVGLPGDYSPASRYVRRPSACATPSARRRKGRRWPSSSICWTPWPCPGGRCAPRRGSGMRPGMPAASIPARELLLQDLRRTWAGRRGLHGGAAGRDAAAGVPAGAAPGLPAVKKPCRPRAGRTVIFSFDIRKDRPGLRPGRSLRMHVLPRAGSITDPQTPGWW